MRPKNQEGPTPGGIGPFSLGCVVNNTTVGLEGDNPNRTTLLEGRPIDLTNARGAADAFKL